MSSYLDNDTHSYCPPYLFFLLVWPPRFQSLLIMGWCYYIPEHRLWLPLDSVPFYVLVSYVNLPVYLRSLEKEYALIFRPAPFRPTGATGPQWRLLPRSLFRSWCLRLRCRRCRPCSCLRVCFSRRLRSFVLLPRQPPVDPGLLPPSLGDQCPPLLLRPLTECQNWPRRNKLRDRILSPEDRCPCSHYPRVLCSSRQGEVQPLMEELI